MTVSPMIDWITEGGVVTLTLDSPRNRNALSNALIDQLIDGLERAAADPANRVVVLTHRGPAFCSGADLAETAAAFDTGAIPVARLGELLAAIWQCPLPVVAKIAGPTRAGGLGIIAAADIAVCASTATFAFSEVRIGVVPAVISSTVLRRVSARAAAELYLTGDVFDGARAEQIGLVTVAVPPDDLDAVTQRYVNSLVRGAPGALAAAKQLAQRSSSEPLLEEIDTLTRLSIQHFAALEGREGITAFREKRDPSWLPSR